MQQFLNTVINWATTAGVKILIALIIMFIAFKVINFVVKKVAKKVDPNIAKEKIASFLPFDSLEDNMIMMDKGDKFVMLVAANGVNYYLMSDAEKESVVRALEAIVAPISLYEPVYSDNGDSIFVIDQLSDSTMGEEMWLESIALREAMRVLNDRERSIITMRFFKNKTQMEIAGEIGISQAQVSRLEKGALERMRKQL